MLIAIYLWVMWIDFKPFNADKNVSSLDRFLSYMNEEDIFDSFPGIVNVIASDVVSAVQYHETIIWTGITC